jgi:WD40 repeat protein
MHYLCFWDFTPNKFLLAILICAICAIKFGNLSRLFSNCAIYLLQSDFYESVFSYLSSQINDLSKYSARKFVSIVREVHGSKLIIVECELKIFDYNTAGLIETQSCHQNLVTVVETTSFGGNELILSSSINEVKLWDAFAVSTGPLHTFEDCKAARFNQGVKAPALRLEKSTALGA